MADIRELAQTLMGSFSDALEKKVAEVEERSVQVERKREELEEEKRMMSSLPSRTESGAEIIEINVGGDIFQTKRATLLAAEGSLLAAMFSGRWEDALDRDKEGRVFLDFDPAHFRILLNHLRLHRIVEPGKVRPPVDAPEHKELFEGMVDFLGMRDFLAGPVCSSQACCDEAALTCEQAGTQDASVRIDGHVISGGISRHRTVVGKTTLVGAIRASRVAWKVTFAKLRPNGFVYTGIICNPTPGDTAYADATSYGWSSQSQVFIAGQRCDTGVDLQEGDNAIFQLDGVGKTLRMFLDRTGQVREIPLRDGVVTQARLLLNLHTPDTEVVVSTVTPDEVSRAGL